MKTKIRIQTPKGQAHGTEKKLRPFLIGKRKIKHTTKVNKADNKIVWEIEGSVKDILKINKNVAMFDKTMKMILNHKLVHGAIGKLSKEDRKELKNMLQNQTSVEVVKY